MRDAVADDGDGERNGGLVVSELLLLCRGNGLSVAVTVQSCTCR